MMTQREIDDAQDELDAETERKRKRCVTCPECGHEFSLQPAPTHVYRVKVLMGSGARRWIYSEPVSKVVAEAQALELRSTGWQAEAMTIEDAAAVQAEADAYVAEKRAARKKGKRG